ncbi:MAG: ORF6N domain-containing protein [Patescibacteria group bacterium]
MSKKIEVVKNLIPIDKVENKILLIRGEKVMLDRDLAELYGVETKVLNQAVKRNKKRFPDDFMFRLTKMESEYLVTEGCFGEGLRSQFVTLKKSTLRGLHIKYLPYVFTEQGVAMLSSVLKSDKAIAVNITIMRTFVKIRKLVYSYDELSKKIMQMEKKYDKSIVKIFEIINKLMDDKEDDKKK